MIRNFATTILLLVLTAATGAAQRTTVDLEPETPRFDLAGGYNLVHANAPPGSCGCFTMNGAFVSADVNLSDRLSVVGEVTGGDAKTISALGQNLTLSTFTAGPRLVWPYHRFEPIGEFLLGVARGTGSYFPSATSNSGSATSFAFSTGGGVDFTVTPRIALRAVDIRYLQTNFPNSADGSQHQLQIETGFVFRFGARLQSGPRY